MTNKESIIPENTPDPVLEQCTPELKVSSDSNFFTSLPEKFMECINKNKVICIIFIVVCIGILYYVYTLYFSKPKKQPDVKESEINVDDIIEGETADEMFKELDNLSEDLPDDSNQESENLERPEEEDMNGDINENMQEYQTSDDELDDNEILLDPNAN